MKRILAAILCLCFLLSGCAGTQEPNEPEVPGTKPENQQLAAFAVKTAQLPELPPMPSDSELMDRLNALDYEKLGEEKYQEENQRLWDEYSAAMTAYFDAVQELRGAGVDSALAPLMQRYTQRTLSQLLASPQGENTVYSPANLYIALCMLSETVAGETQSQLLELLGLSSPEQAREAAGALWRNLYNETTYGKTTLANALWLNEQVAYNDETVDHLAKDYYTSVYRAVMGDKATDAAIAQWVNENTGHLLEEAAGALETTPDTVMMLLSALYFKNEWVDAFQEGATREDVFTTAAGAEQKIDFMHMHKNGSIIRGENYAVAGLPFKDGISMTFLLPDRGTALSDVLSAESAMEDWFHPQQSAEAEYGEIHWSVPKFDVSSDLDLVDALRALGVEDVFDDSRADFSPLTDLELPMAVTQVKHAARVTVNEDGCEAAAFTAIMVEATSAAPDSLPVFEMDLDRPFAFLITGVDGLPLFIGCVNSME